MRTKRGAHLVPRSGWAATNAENPGGSNRAPARSSRAAITWSPEVRVGNGVDGARRHVGVTLEDPLDGGGGEVLGVDAQAVTQASGEVEVALLVAIAEVSAPVPPVVHALGVAHGVLVVALEAPPPTAVHDLADGLPGVLQPPGGVEPGPGPFDPGVGVEDHDVVARQRHAERSRRRVGGDVDGGAALARSVPLDQAASETPFEFGPVRRGGLGSEALRAARCRGRRRRSGVAST